MTGRTSERTLGHHRTLEFPDLVVEKVSRRQMTVEQRQEIEGTSGSPSRSGSSLKTGIAYGVLYLASDESKFLTGEESLIDGGFTTH